MLTLFSFLLIGGCQSASPPSSSEDARKIKEISAAREAAFNKSDAEKIATYFTADAVLMAPGQPADTGRAAVVKYYQSIFDTYEPELSSHYVNVEVFGKHAYGRGIAEVTLTPKDGGGSVTSTSKYINILEKQSDGTWRTTHDIWNANVPASGE
jgi:uncharacterized protein (TIGR02246 family)